ncbi:MAG: hypothetical protein HRJ53_14280 [Acidobacteria bacterium Pan2503]|uniref:Uncharacterized protein n=1 Tax=Candidatus Acidiferrum panamense TaxID=2741543 RepID=A0A7V8NRP2_9BACT|nr:hypothetical protein [Candidatus Acidoferrum panamensis]
MSTPSLDRSKPYAEIHDALGQTMLEQNGIFFNGAGVYLSAANPASPTPAAHTPQPTPAPMQEPEPEQEPAPDEDQEGHDQENHRHAPRHHKGHHR